MDTGFPSLREAAGAPQGRTGPMAGRPPPQFVPVNQQAPAQAAAEGPPRERGFIASVKDGYGFIRCVAKRRLTPVRALGFLLQPARLTRRRGALSAAAWTATGSCSST